jgi:hypothetical protein
MGQLQSGFLPSRDGFAFDNSWPPAPGVSVRTPAGTLRIGNAAAGLCGGMVFAALDYWHARAVPPDCRPVAGTPLYRFIVRRLIDSWHMPAGVARYYWWMNLPDADVAGRTMQRHWPLVRASLDSGRPAVLGLVTVKSARPWLLGHNHQVLACAYGQAGSRVTVAVYDPNSGRDDGVQIAFDSSGPAPATTFAHNIDIGWPVRGFFLTGYSSAAPPAD